METDGIVHKNGNVEHRPLTSTILYGNTCYEMAQHSHVLFTEPKSLAYTYKDVARTYNPSVCIHNGKSLYTYKISNYTWCDEKCKEKSDYLFHNKKKEIYHCIGLEYGANKYNLLAFTSSTQDIQGYEDARPVSFGDLIILVTACKILDKHKVVLLCLEASELEHDDPSTIKILRNVTIVPLRSPNPDQDEKNWIPWIFPTITNGQSIPNTSKTIYTLYLSKHLCPHDVVKVTLEVSREQLQRNPPIPVLNITSSLEHHHSRQWNIPHSPNLKNIRGGTQAIHVPQKNLFLTLAHIRYSEMYTHLFLAFEPLNGHIIAKGPEFVFTGKHRVEFAAGLAIEGPKVYVTFGVQDCHSYNTMFDLDIVLASMNL